MDDVRRAAAPVCGERMQFGKAGPVANARAAPMITRRVTKTPRARRLFLVSGT
jgi:hypothetical protein